MLLFAALLDLLRFAAEVLSKVKAKSIRRVFVPVSIIGAGLTFALLFDAGVLLPVKVLTLSLLALTLWALSSVRMSRLSLLPRFMILVYALPFSVLIGYLFSEDYTWAWTPQAIELTQDDLLMRQLTTVGLVGLIGFIAGMRWAVLFRPSAYQIQNYISENQFPRRKTLSVPLYYTLLAVSLFFSFLSAPKQTIFETPYGGEQLLTWAIAINFNGAYVVSYVILVVLLIDAERESVRACRRTKLLSLCAATLYIVVFLQLLRGDRESSGLIVALVALYLSSPVKQSEFRRWRRGVSLRVRRVVLLLSICVPVFIALGSARSVLSEVSPEFSPWQFLQVGWRTSPWTMTLLTNLGVASLYRDGSLEYRNGQTYLDYVLSLPPGVLARIVGYDRPVEAERNLAVEIVNTGLTSGGLHVVLVPFMNFGILGTLLVLAAYGYAIARLELASQGGTFWPRLLWGSTFVVGFMWFWYGEMSMVRGVMAAVIVGFVYKLSLPYRLTLKPVSRELKPAHVEGS